MDLTLSRGIELSRAAGDEDGMLPNPGLCFDMAKVEVLAGG